jgi:hypothetical protein
MHKVDKQELLPGKWAQLVTVGEKAAQNVISVVQTSRERRQHEQQGVKPAHNLALVDLAPKSVKAKT